MGDGSSLDHKFAYDWEEWRQAPTGQAGVPRHHTRQNDLKLTLKQPWMGLSVSALLLEHDDKAPD